MSFANAIALATALIAAAAFVASIFALRVAKANQAGRLTAVVPLSGQHTPPVGFGFKVINGPGEITVSKIWLDIAYSTSAAIKGFKEMVSDGQKYIMTVDSAQFSTLGLTGPSPGFRLAPYDEAEWRMPYTAFNFPSEYKSDRGNEFQHVEFHFSVTAARDTRTSEPYSFGARNQPIIYSNTTYLDFDPTDILDYNLPEGLRTWIKLLMRSASPTTESESAPDA